MRSLYPSRSKMLFAVTALAMLVALPGFGGGGASAAISPRGGGVAFLGHCPPGWLPAQSLSVERGCIPYGAGPWAE
jgi:hypothetical protein